MTYGLPSVLTVYHSFIIHEVLCDMLHMYLMVYISDILMYTWVTSVVQLLVKFYQWPKLCIFALKFVTHVPCSLLAQSRQLPAGKCLIFLIRFSKVCCLILLIGQTTEAMFQHIHYFGLLEDISDLVT